MARAGDVEKAEEVVSALSSDAGRVCQSAALGSPDAMGTLLLVRGGLLLGVRVRGLALAAGCRMFLGPLPLLVSHLLDAPSQFVGVDVLRQPGDLVAGLS